jgi:hypothetical protein
MSDTLLPKHLEVVDDQIADILRNKGGKHSVQMIASGWDLMRTMIRAQIRRSNPQWDTPQIEKAINDRMSHGST